MDDHDFVLIPMEFWGISILGNMYMVVMMKNMIHMIVQYIQIATPKNLKKTKTIKRHTLIVVMFHGASGIDFTYNKVWKPMVLEHPESSYVDLILLWSMDWLVLGKYRKPSVFPLNMGYIYIYGYMGLSCKCSLKPIH